MGKKIASRSSDQPIDQRASVCQGWPVKMLRNMSITRGERLILGEPLQPRRHGIDRHEGAADKRQREDEDEERCLHGLRCADEHADRDPDPGEREGEHQQDPQTDQPVSAVPSGRKPTARPTTNMIATASMPRNRSVIVRPATTAERDIGNERKRSISPFCKS